MVGQPGPKHFDRPGSLRVPNPELGPRKPLVGDLTIIGLTPSEALPRLAQAGFHTLRYAEEDADVVFTTDFVPGRVTAITKDGVIARLWL
jgi:hypothetical protein